LEFYDTLKLLADRAGVKLEHTNQEAYSEKKKLYELNELAMRFFHHVLLKTDPGKKAKNYLIERGIKDETIEEFYLGYSVNQKDALSKFLIKKGIPLPLLIKSGLVIEKDQKIANQLPIFDRFRGRVIFPIFNQTGAPVGFTGRIMPEFDTGDMAKYLNSSDSPIFNKSFTLYGLNLAKREIMDKNHVVLVEGQMDVISAYQAGFKNTIASSGTALTESQLDLLKRFTNRIYFAFDQDDAGRAATERGVELAVARGFFVYIVLIPKPYKDVDECIKADPKKWTEALKNKKEFLDYLFDLYAQKGKTAEERKIIAEKILPWVNKVADPILKGEWLKKIADKLEIAETYLYEALEKILVKNPQDQSKSSEINIAKEPQEPKIKERVLALGFVFPKLFKNFSKSFEEIFQSDPLYKKVIGFYNKNDHQNKDKFLVTTAGPDFSLAVLEVENDYEIADLELAKAEIRDLINFLKQKDKFVSLENIRRQIKQAEKIGDQEKVKKLLKRLQDIILKK
ncbi:MAG: DNA primase, partial [Patescibacteria group bacterium]|nr:DNA primase [Patescibacteria group bacterium]